ncbi:enolase-phosphatase E1 isoform X3 [Scophthalmus maximus]|uniref:enolase-phosphatase E1 isoform X3 n=1 Tax=Scophthalmus maximus TaxID=52904 RepID=UPI001FA915D9|nr:enolase-phosphatase E1 isoform X3 [Scophthalmus maximus]
MDHTEDLSARVLLKNILSTELPRTPITRSTSKVQSTSGTRRSSRLSKKDAGAQTPQDILRRSLKHKVRESITRKSLPAATGRASSVVLRKINTSVFDDGDTPRHILRNILRTEPVKSPVVHDSAASEEAQLPSANSSLTSKRSSIELSGLDLPDLTIGNAASIAKGLSRKRPRRSLNVTAFEKRLKGGSDVEEENEESLRDHSSLSLSSSSTSLSLKTPFVDVWTEDRGLQRRVKNRPKITEEEFGAAVNKWQMGDDQGESKPQPPNLNKTSFSEGVTLGLSLLSEPDITTDIVNCNTALYTQPDSMISSFSVVATQDKPTGMAVSQTEGDAASRSQSEEEQVVIDSQTEGEEGEDIEAGSQAEEEEVALDSQTEEEGAVDSQSGEDVEAGSQADEEEVALDSQTEEEGAVDSQSGEDVEAGSQADEEEVALDSQTEEEGAVDSQSGEDVEAGSQADEEEVALDSQTEEEGAVDSQSGEDVEAGSKVEEEVVAPDSQTEEDGAVDSQEEDVEAEEEEEVAPDSQTVEEEEGAVDSQSEEDAEAGSQAEAQGDAEDYQSDQEVPAAHSQSEEDQYVTESQTEDEHDGKQEEEEEEGEQASEQLEHYSEHISRRAHRSEGGLIMPVTEAEGYLPDATEAGWCEGRQPHAGTSDLAESSTRGQKDPECDAGKDNSHHFLEVMDDIVEGGHLSDASSEEEAAAPDPVEQEDDWEDEEDEESAEFSGKTPAFVKEKRNFFYPVPQASSSVQKNIEASSSEALPAAKPKRVQQRRPAKKAACLPKSYLMSVFRHFAKAKVSPDVYPVLSEIMDKYFDRLASDLETYAGHAKRKTIEVEDAVLLLKRQGYVNDKVPVEVLIEKFLRMEQRKLLIPIATSGNVVIPKKGI